MKTAPRWFHPKRLGPLIVLEAMLAQAVTPAFAVSTGYSGTMSQLPAAFITPPEANIMFTLDDSLSMHSDAIPDFLATNAAGNAVNLSNMPSTDASNATAPEITGATFARQFPAMWKTGSEYLSAKFYSNGGLPLNITGGTPENVIGRYMRSPAGNPLYYNPAVRYRPWPDPANDKLTLADANPAAVNIHPSDPFNAGTTINLTVQATGSDGLTFWPATYFVKTSTPPLPVADPYGAASQAAVYTRYEITNVATLMFPKSEQRTDCVSVTSPVELCSRQEELQNFANWLQYYRNRMLMAKGGVATAFARQGTNLRVGFGTINSTVQLGVRVFSGANRTAVYNKIYPVARSTSGTPLRAAMGQVGEYFKDSTSTGPWAFDPGASVKSPEYACRRSFHILSTDGFWNGGSASSAAAANNEPVAGDKTPKNVKGVAFTYGDVAGSKWAVSPYKDGASDTLADVAAYYWKTDLRTDMANNVITSPRDPAFWQHVSTYTVGLGVSGTGTITKTTGGAVADLATQAGRDLLVANQTALNWPSSVSAGSFATGDDLIHAAMNGRGRYFAATDPSSLASNLSSALAEAADNPGDVATVAVDSSQLATDGKLYQAIFNPSRWYGRLYAFKQGSSGDVNNKPTDAQFDNPDQLWEASNKMPPPANRNIYTSGGTSSSGALFDWSAGLTTAQKGYVGNADIVDFLRGDASLEVANGGLFRDRSRYTVKGVTGGVLGDVINGSPLKGPDAGVGYDRLPSAAGEQSTYAAFRTGSDLDKMRDTMFLGANDGMLHAFNLNDGVERFAYVPNAVYNVRTTATGFEKKLQLLATDLTGTHRLTVDGPPNVSDAYIGSKWRTVLTASNGAGARGVFAIDVTNPDVSGASGTISAFGTNNLLWEFTDANNVDMGYVLAYPHVARMVTGDWVLIFGNGYDSKNGQAKLFILNLSNGSVLKEIAVGAAGENGLSQPNLLLNSNREVIAIYAGDLKGNLWKFDVNNSDKSLWASAFGTEPLFKAVGPTLLAQPISVMPEITAHPQGGAMITFGTGKIFETSDTATTGNVNLTGKQSIYGIWDKPSETVGIAALTTTTRSTVLKPQTVTTAPADPAVFGATSNNVPAWGSQRGWYLDLAAGGERVTIPPQQVKKVVYAVTLTPAANDPCASGGDSAIFAFDPVTGSRPTFPVFDVNDDKKFTTVDDGNINFTLVRGALLTQPIFQSAGPSSSSPSATASTLTPYAPFDRGQVSSARAGGVELARSFGGKVTGAGSASPDPNCESLATAAQSDSSLFSIYVQSCVKDKARISWRQLK
jgi:type IV pilus assembly protein PilY1